MKLLAPLLICAIILLIIKIVFSSDCYIMDSGISIVFSIVEVITNCKYSSRLLGVNKCNEELDTSIVHTDVPRSDVIFFIVHDYEELPEYAQKATHLTKDYCNKHGYTFLDIRYPKGLISPYWLRVDALTKLTKLYPANTMFVYMDLDACINSYVMNFPLHRIISSLKTNQLYDIYIGKDIDLTKLVNSGVFIIRNTEWSRQFVDEWWSKHDSNNWTYNNNKWKCVTKTKKCTWAGLEYEQGQFDNLYKSDWNGSKTHIAILKIDLISNHFIQRKSTIIYHLMGHTNDDRTKFFNGLIAQYHKQLE